MDFWQQYIPEEGYGLLGTGRYTDNMKISAMVAPHVKPEHYHLYRIDLRSGSESPLQGTTEPVQADYIPIILTRMITFPERYTWISGRMEPWEL